MVCRSPVSTLRTVTRASGTIAPVLSSTAPPKLAVVYWATAGAVKHRSTEIRRSAGKKSDDSTYIHQLRTCGLLIQQTCGIINPTARYCDYRKRLITPCSLERPGCRESCYSSPRRYRCESVRSMSERPETAGVAVIVSPRLLLPRNPNSLPALTTKAAPSFFLK